MNKILKTSLFFILAYVLSQTAYYFFSKDNFFTSPMYILLPIFAFFAFLFFTPMIEEYTKWNKWIILGLFMGISVVCYILIFYIYMYEIFVVLQKSTMPPNLGFWGNFISSAFLGFIISGAVGIIASKK